MSPCSLVRAMRSHAVRPALHAIERRAPPRPRVFWCLRCLWTVMHPAIDEGEARDEGESRRASGRKGEETE